MAIHGDTLTRQWKILRQIPRYPRKRTASEIHQTLCDDSQIITKRTVERDLVALSTLFPIVADESDKPYGWSWAKGAPTIDIPSMSDAEAVTFKLLELHLGHLLPPSYREKLEPYFATAEQRLKVEHGARLARSLADKIRVIQPRRGVIPCVIRQDVQDAVLEGLLKERQLQLTYLRKAEGALEEHTLTPCAVVQFWGRTWLVASRDGVEVEVFKLHRVREATVLAAKASIPKHFDVDRYLFPKSFPERSRQGVQYRGICTRQAAEVLIDRPIGLDQRILFDGTDHAWVEATVPRDAKIYLEELEQKSGGIDDMDVTFYHGRFWGETQPAMPIGGLDE